MNKRAVSVSALLTLAGLGLASAQTTGQTAAAVTIPPVLQLTVANASLPFDFSATATAASLTPYGGGVLEANATNYNALLNSGAVGTPVQYAPNGALPTIATVVTNYKGWTLNATAVTNNRDVTKSTLTDARLKVKATVSGSRAIPVAASFTTFASVRAATTAIATCAANGGGKSIYSLYYTLDVDPGDSFVFASSTTNYSETITVGYSLVSP